MRLPLHTQRTPRCHCDELASRDPRKIGCGLVHRSDRRDASPTFLRRDRAETVENAEIMTARRGGALAAWRVHSTQRRDPCRIAKPARENTVVCQVESSCPPRNRGRSLHPGQSRTWREHRRANNFRLLEPLDSGLLRGTMRNVLDSRSNGRPGVQGCSCAHGPRPGLYRVAASGCHRGGRRSKNAAIPSCMSGLPSTAAIASPVAAHPADVVAARTCRTARSSAEIDVGEDLQTASASWCATVTASPASATRVIRPSRPAVMPSISSPANNSPMAMASGSASSTRKIPPQVGTTPRRD